jgi:hypothetical protein
MGWHAASARGDEGHSSLWLPQDFLYTAWMHSLCHGACLAANQAGAAKAASSLCPYTAHTDEFSIPEIQIKESNSNA